jgi:hypothetical protein
VTSFVDIAASPPGSAATAKIDENPDASVVTAHAPGQLDTTRS